jgi:hypothetical protein
MKTNFPCYKDSESHMSYTICPDKLVGGFRRSINSGLLEAYQRIKNKEMRAGYRAALYILKTMQDPAAEDKPKDIDLLLGQLTEAIAEINSIEGEE